MKHVSVLLNETIDLLQIREDGVYVDLTLGGGGHSLKIIESLKKGTLYVFDLDEAALKSFKEKTKQVSKAAIDIKFINDNFRNISEHLETKVDGIIADLGWSTDQLENLEGLSHEKDQNNLDMRFDQNLGVKASDLLNALNRKELEKMFREYSDLYGKYNDFLVNEIIKTRESKLFEKVGDLKVIMDKVFSKEKNKNGFYSKVFQSLRIAVNQEFINLKEMMELGFENLNEGGSFLIITFHSGELKIVQNFFDEKVENNEAKYLTKKFGEVFLTPSVDELKLNMSSRSAKLFGIQKI